MTFTISSTSSGSATSPPPGLVSPVVAFTNAISQQAKSSDGSARNALALLGRMRQQGVSPTAVTLNAVIDAQSKQGDGSARVALELLDAMKKSTTRDVRPTVVTYTSVIDCQAKCKDGDGRTAVALLEEMVSEGLMPNNITFGCCINAQAKRGSAKMATVLLRKMIQRGLTPSATQFNAVIDAHAKCQDGSAREAKAVLDYMAESGAKATIVSYSTCIEAQAKREDGSAVVAASCLVQLLEQGLVPDAITFAGVIDAQAKRRDGSARTAVMILSRMEQCCPPNQVHFNSVINACANERPSTVTLAEPVLQAMIDHGFKPNSFTLSALFRCAGFSQPQRPELAKQWFDTYCRSGTVDINDHVARALRVPLGAEADELLASVGSQFVSRRGRSSHSSHQTNRMHRHPSSHYPTQQHKCDKSNWRSSGMGDSSPSALLFSTPRRAQSWRSNSDATLTCNRSRTPSPPTTPTVCSEAFQFSDAAPTRRPSLKEKISAIKTRRASATNLPFSTTERKASATSLLLVPSHFGACNTPRSPCGPDGTKGFTARRSIVSPAC